MPNIAIVWDFDGTLSPGDSTTKTVEILQGQKDCGDFWHYIHRLRGDTKDDEWEHVLASDAPIWMYSLSRIAFEKGVPLNDEFFKEFIVPKISLFPEVISFLEKIKSLENRKDFIELKLKVHHFIVSAGLKDLIEQVFSKDLITWTFGCRYTVVASKDDIKNPESVPVFCIDETMKTRALFEISKGAFNNKGIKVNSRVQDEKLWAPFKNIIYIGDGPTDVPALSLTRDRGGLGVVVCDPDKTKDDLNKRLNDMRLDKRADLITFADFKDDGELFKYLKTRCIQIKQRYEAEKFI